MRVVLCVLVAAIAVAPLACERADDDTPPIPTPTPSPPPTPPSPEPEPAPAGTVTAFAAGSLIIPTGATYQTSCGAISAYGLVYDVLRANSWLVASGHRPVTIHYAYKAAKSSPNRCVPTNLHVPPSYTGGPSPVPYNDAVWNDGCDLRVVDATVTPVRQLVNGTASNAATDIDIATISTTGRSDVYPTYGSVTIKHTLVASTNVFDVGYAGGPFVVAAADVAIFTRLLDGSLVARDVYNNPIDFTPFRTNAGSCTLGTHHYVRVHRAAVAFTAETNRSFTNTPPRLGLLASNRAGMTKNVASGILEKYLVNAGLDFEGAQGCPPGSYNATSAAICPRGGTPGQIYDLFDFADLVRNLHTLTDSAGMPYYASLWAPHWDSTATSTVGPNTDERTAVANLDSWLDRQYGLMAECASIGALEGDYKAGSKDVLGSQQFLTCVNDGSGACGTATTGFGLDKDLANVPTGILRNCTDPTLAAGASCVYYGTPGDPFVQTADYLWEAPAGSVKNWLPNAATSSLYRAGVTPTIGAVKTLDKAKLATSALARTMVTADFAAYGKKASDPYKGQISYLAGHDLTGSIAGNLVVLQTLLQLGNVDTSTQPVTTESSRATPVVATIDGAPALVQGSFEVLTPAPPVPVVNTDADASVFTFPAVRGHLRAIPTADVGFTASKFSDVTAILDAASQIPPASYAGCASTFSGACRTVFTTTLGGRLPPLVHVNVGNRSVLGPLIGAGLTSASQDTLIARVLAGFRAASGTYEPRLGGVDRSAAAVIPPSTVAGRARPTMIYVGATDGMMHAICASVMGPCDVLGRELWAYVPRTQLPRLRYNTTRLDGTPRVLDVFGDFDGTGRKQFRTVLLFQTGTGEPAAAGQQPAVYALDVTDPTAPRVLWEYTTPSARTTFELGRGLTIAAGPTVVGGVTRNLTLVQTNNGGTGGAGHVITAIDTETGAKLWQWGYAYPAPRTSGSALVPATGIPGGVVGVDRTASARITDLVVGDLYGNLWLLDPATGASRWGAGKPLFSFSTDYHPIGVPPAVYASNDQLFAVVASGGFVDPTGATWGSGRHQAVVVRLDAPPRAAALDETSGPPDVPYVIDFGVGERAFSQPLVLGNRIYLVTDTTDVNATSFGSAANTGRIYTLDLDTGVSRSQQTIAAGAASLANDGISLYSASGPSVQQVTSAASATGAKVDNLTPLEQARRLLWLNVD